MTTGTEHTAVTAEANGQAPPPPGEPAAEQTTMGERIMGLIGLAFAIGLALIGLDLITGGAVARLLGADGEQDASGGS